jgi:hypothetical protein
VSAEGGIIDEEFRIKYVQDRINTVGTAFMGLTLECASCHDHKFDPISQKDYYQLSAFFNNQKELGMVAEGGSSSGPVLLLPDPEKEHDLKQLEEELEQAFKELKEVKTDWIVDAKGSNEQRRLLFQHQFQKPYFLWIRCAKKKSLSKAPYTGSFATHLSTKWWITIQSPWHLVTPNR